MIGQMMGGRKDRKLGGTMWGRGERPRRFSGMAFVSAVLLLAGILLCFCVPVTALPEERAPQLRPDVVAVTHAPEPVPPHTQWTGTLVLTPHSNVTAAAFQVCIVGEACFAPPTPMTSDGSGTWNYDTRTYLSVGKPVDYQPGWRMGVKFHLQEPGGLVQFPDGPNPTSQQCLDDHRLCAELHYFSFAIADDGKDSPFGGVALVGMAIGCSLVLAWRRAA